MQHRVHGPVLQPDQTVAMAPQVDAVQAGQSRLSPAPDQMTEKGGRGWDRTRRRPGCGTVTAWLQAADAADGSPKAACGRCRRDGVGRHAIPSEHIAEVQPVDRAQGVEAENGGGGIFVLDIGEAAEGDCELVVVMTGGELLAGLLHVAVSQFKLLANPFELFARPLHDMIPLGHRRVNAVCPTHCSKTGPILF